MRWPTAEEALVLRWEGCGHGATPAVEFCPTCRFAARCEWETGMITPVEERDGRWYKRDDLLRHPSGVNGGKWRQCRWLIDHMRGDVVVTGASVLSPQHAMTAIAASEAGKRSYHVIGGTSIEKASRYPSVRMALAAGAHFERIAVGYNPALQSRVAHVAQRLAGEILRYGVTPDSNASPATLYDFHMLGARQTVNLPDDLRTLIVPFGSGNSAASILLGLVRHPRPPDTVVLVGIGPDRQNWLGARLRTLGLSMPLPFSLQFVKTGYEYSSRFRWREDGLDLHPTYEAKVATWCDLAKPRGWEERDGSCAFWIVGGAL